MVHAETAAPFRYHEQMSTRAQKQRFESRKAIHLMSRIKTLEQKQRAWRTMDYIDAHPEKHDQTIWLYNPGESTEEEPYCGVTGCYAGWTSVLAGDKILPYRSVQYIISADTHRRKMIQNRAAELLGLTQGEADMLFDGDNTRDDLQAMIEEIFGPRPSAS